MPTFADLKLLPTLVESLADMMGEGVRAPCSGRVDQELDPPDHVVAPLSDVLDRVAGPSVAECPPVLGAAAGKWADHPTDRFIYQTLTEQGLTPSDPADRRTLIRRATYDLHGLPPSPEEIEAFVSDTDPRAYEKLIDRLLTGYHQQALLRVTGREEAAVRLEEY